TTLSMDDTAKVIDALRKHFPAIEGPRKDDICYATQNRQDAVKQLASECDLVLVVGSPNSSNSNRLRELSDRMGTPAYLIDGADEIRPEWLEGVSTIGVTAGASAPDILVQQVIQHLRDSGADSVTELAGREENIVFSMPKELRVAQVNCAGRRAYPREGRAPARPRSCQGPLIEPFGPLSLGRTKPSSSAVQRESPSSEPASALRCSHPGRVLLQGDARGKMAHRVRSRPVGSTFPGNVFPPGRSAPALRQPEPVQPWDGRAPARPPLTPQPTPTT